MKCGLHQYGVAVEEGECCPPPTAPAPWGFPVLEGPAIVLFSACTRPGSLFADPGDAAPPPGP